MNYNNVHVDVLKIIKCDYMNMNKIRKKHAKQIRMKYINYNKVVDEIKNMKTLYENERYEKQQLIDDLNNGIDSYMKHISAYFSVTEKGFANFFLNKPFFEYIH